MSCPFPPDSYLDAVTPMLIRNCPAANLQTCPGDMPCAVRFIEVINDEDAIFGNHRRPRIAKVAVAAVVAEDNLFGVEASAFGIKHAGANAEGRMAIAIDEEHAFV